MRRFLGALLLVVLALTGFVQAPAANATPKLYVYEGSACPASANIAQMEAFLGRKVDGLVNFNDYTKTPAGAVANLNWGLWCYRSYAPSYNVAIGVGLAFNGMSTAQVAAGAADSDYAQIGQAFVKNGFPHAYIRLGWEMGGNWYPWGVQGATFVAAYNHVAPILKANCPGCTIVFNTAASMDSSSEFPGRANVDAMGWDVYEVWGALASEPALWTDNLNNSWGLKSIGPGGWFGSLPVVVPEFGAGSQSGGNGACASKVWNACDDGVFMANALAFFTKQNVGFVGYWDYNAGDYNSRISDGSRPQEALAFLKVFGAPGQIAIFTAHAASFTTQTPPKITATNCQATPFQTAPNQWDVVVFATASSSSCTVGWSGATTSANRYDASVGVRPVQALGAAASWTGSITAGHPYVIEVRQAAAPAPAIAAVLAPRITASAPAPDLQVTVAPINGQVATATVVPNKNGSDTLALSMPKTASQVTWIYKLSSPRRLGFGDGEGGLSGSLWNGGGMWTGFTWTSKGGAAQVYVAPAQAPAAQ